MKDDLVYLAGILDGEGYIGTIERNSPLAIAPRIAVCNTNKGLVTWLSKTFGGKFYPMIRNTRKNDKPCYQWIVFTLKDVLNVLKLVKSHLKFKRTQANLLVEYCTSRLARNPTTHRYSVREKEISRKLKLLNQRGIHPI